MKKLIALLLALVMVLGMVACGAKEEAPAEAPAEEVAEEKKEETTKAEELVEESKEASENVQAEAKEDETVKETVVVGNIRDITMVNPFGSNTTENLNLFKMTHSTLLVADPATYEISEGLAESYEVSDDGLVWTFKIHEGVKFHNGEDCDADDVLYSLTHWQESSFTANKVKWIEKAEKLDDYTVQFTLSQPYQEMKYVFAFPNICIVNEKAITEDPDLGYKIGTGPYVIDEWILGEKTTLSRFEDFYGEMPKTKNWEFRLITEDSSRVIALENGEIDICIQPPPIQNDYIADNEDLELLSVVGNKLNYVALNLEKEIWKNPVARQIIAHCMDRETIIEVATEGLGTPANSVISPKTPFYNPDQTVIPYDLEAAKKLMEENNINPADLSFTIICNGSVRETIATVIQADLASIGINIEVQNLEASALKAQLNERQHDACVYNWAPAPSDGTDITFTSLWLTDSGSNRSIMAEPELDAKIAAAAIELDGAKREQMYHEMQDYLVNYAAFIPLYYETITMGVSANLRNFVCDVAEQHNYTYAYVVE